MTKLEREDGLAAHNSPFSNLLSILDHHTPSPLRTLSDRLSLPKTSGHRSNVLIHAKEVLGVVLGLYPL
jgi:hypothetical protein